MDNKFFNMTASGKNRLLGPRTDPIRPEMAASWKLTVGPVALPFGGAKTSCRSQLRCAGKRMAALEHKARRWAAFTTVSIFPDPVP
ncbi:protein of unknown function [Hyphomicrobium sp. MC1]|nr:protein of unknown function [Hyphomicrobium sp. MC1]